ncbi:hypothetical protein [Butyrivibrio fibrisolvens]|uniref:hypothetical protein n=1 Tax=Butyrivibrio fibrisolvens TaxID=831 RepID=UPI0020BDB673|nr:hypothetical protein [Butyrivibrio fibrisolvens]
MNSKIVTTLTAAITCLSIVSGGAAIYYDKTHDKGNITIDSREEFLSVNQDLMPQTAASIVQGSGDVFLEAMFTGREIPDTDTDILIWAKSDDPEFQTVLEDTSLDLKIHYDKNNSEALVNAFITENGSQTLSLYADIEGDTAGLYSPSISEYYYDLTKEQFINGFETTTGISLAATSNAEDASQDSAKDNSDSHTDNTSIEDSEFMNILDVILTAVTKDNVTATYSDNLHLEHVDETISGTTYTCQPSADDFENMLYDLCDYMDTHESARSYIHNILGNISDKSDTVLDIETLLVNEDGCLKNKAKEIATNLSCSAFTWSVISDNTGTGRALNLSFICNGTNIVLTCEKASKGAMYMSATLDDSYISILKTPSETPESATSLLGLSYGTIEITACDKSNTTKALITTTRSEDNTKDETVISFNAGSRIGNIELHIESKNSSTASMPLTPAEMHIDMTSSSDEEVMTVFKTYHNKITSILLSSKILGMIL